MVAAKSKGEKLKWCCRPDCYTLVRKPRAWCNRGYAVCDTCDTEMCFKCGAKWHQGKCGGPERLLLSQDLIQCPKCDTVCEFDWKFCKHFSCKCGHHFTACGAPVLVYAVREDNLEIKWVKHSFWQQLYHFECHFRSQTVSWRRIWVTIYNICYFSIVFSMVQMIKIVASRVYTRIFLIDLIDVKRRRIYQFTDDQQVDPYQRVSGAQVAVEGFVLMFGLGLLFFVPIVLLSLLHMPFGFVYLLYTLVKDLYRYFRFKCFYQCCQRRRRHCFCCS